MNAPALLLVLAAAAAAPADDGGPAGAAGAEAAERSSTSADADVLAFLSPTNRTASRDGEGATGETKRYLTLRNFAVNEAHAVARALQGVRMQGSEGGAAAAELRASLLNLTGAPLEKARAAFQEAIKWEERRLSSLDWAETHADAAGRSVPEYDRLLVARRLAAIRAGSVSDAAERWVGGYRDVALGLAAYLDGEQFRALEKMQQAADALPEFSPAHAFLGSLYFLFDKKESALRAWRRALELDPGNEEVRQALAAYGAKEGMEATRSKTQSAEETPATKSKAQPAKEMQARKSKAQSAKEMQATKSKPESAKKMQATSGATDPENTL